MDRFLLYCISILMFILSVDGTLALRYLLIVLLLFFLVNAHVRNGYNLLILRKSNEFKLIFGSYLLFILYVFLHSIFLAVEPLWSLSEFKSHVFYPLIYFIVGLLLANYVNQSKNISKETLITILFYSLFVHILYIDLVALDKLFHDGVIISRYGGLMDSPVLPNYLTNILLAMIIAEFVYRMRVKKQILKVSNPILYMFLVACIFSTFVEALRLGDIALVFLGIGSSMVFLYQNHDYSKNKRRLIAVSLIFVLTIPLIYNISTDPRWAKLIETVPVAVSSSDEEHWLDPTAEIPKTESGHEVSGSNYTRIVYAVKSFKYITEDPMGVGYGRNAFGHALELRHPAYGKRGQHSHSAILELALGAGVFGVVIWLTFVYIVTKTAIVEFKRSYNFYAILTLFLTMGFVGRGLVDANMRDHMFVQFMLLLGITLHFMLEEKNKAID